MRSIQSLEDAWILCEGDRISAVGQMDSCPDHQGPRLDAGGRHILPTWVDSHTHLVFARTREEEFRYRLEGMSYEEIARRGGGILNSAYRLRETPEDQLLEDAARRLHEVIRTGTGAIEIKSGYGLTLDSEMKMLRVIRRLRDQSPIPIRATLLAAAPLLAGIALMTAGAGLTSTLLGIRAGLEGFRPSRLLEVSAPGAGAG